LFETTVFKDVIFGPSNLGLDKLECELRSYDALKMVGIGEDLLDASPFELSGGQKRRVAIAGVLAMKPEVLILDEPTAALDPFAEAEVYEKFHQLSGGRTTVYISHRLSSCKFCDRILFLEDGRIIDDGNHAELISRKGKYAQMFTLQASQYVS
jgi:energy-coupling factor transport system ATP-binding protein